MSYRRVSVIARYAPRDLMDKTFYVYILSNKYNSVLYAGISNNLERRTFEHRNKNNPDCFTARYNLNKLLYYSIFPAAFEAIAAEKKIKKWPVWKKRELIKTQNPDFMDLFPAQ